MDDETNDRYGAMSDWVLPMRRFHRRYISPSAKWGYRNIGVPMARRVLPFTGRMLYNYGIDPAIRMGRRFVVDPAMRYVGDRASDFHNYMMEDSSSDGSTPRRSSRKRLLSRPMPFFGPPNRDPSWRTPARSKVQKSSSKSRKSTSNKKTPPDSELRRRAIESYIRMGQERMNDDDKRRIVMANQAQTQALFDMVQRQGLLSPRQQENIPSDEEMIRMLSAARRRSSRSGSRRNPTQV